MFDSSRGREDITWTNLHCLRKSCCALQCRLADNRTARVLGYHTVAIAFAHNKKPRPPYQERLQWRTDQQVDRPPRMATHSSVIERSINIDREETD